MSANLAIERTFPARGVPALRDETASEVVSRGAFELLVRDNAELDRSLLDEAALPSWIGRLLGVAAIGLGVQGLAVGLVAHLLPEARIQTCLPWLQGHPVVWLPLTLFGAMAGALAICLPSFYFFTQLSGLDASFRLVMAQALRVQAKTSVLLLGMAPFYVALALGAIVTGKADDTFVVLVGLALPFVVGLAGIGTLYRAFEGLLQVVPITHPRRGAFLLRLVLCWGVLYSAVAPLAVYRLGELLGRVF